MGQYHFSLGFTDDDWSEQETPESLTQKVMEQVKQAYTVKASHESAESLKRLERHLILKPLTSIGKNISGAWIVYERASGYVPMVSVIPCRIQTRGLQSLHGPHGKDL